MEQPEKSRKVAAAIAKAVIEGASSYTNAQAVGQATGEVAVYSQQLQQQAGHEKQEGRHGASSPEKAEGRSPTGTYVSNPPSKETQALRAKAAEAEKRLKQAEKKQLGDTLKSQAKVDRARDRDAAEAMGQSEALARNKQKGSLRSPPPEGQQNNGGKGRTSLRQQGGRSTERGQAGGSEKGSLRGSAEGRSAKQGQQSSTEGKQGQSTKGGSSREPSSTKASSSSQSTSQERRR